LKKIERVLSDKLLQVEKELFQNKSMVFIKAAEEEAEEDEDEGDNRNNREYSNCIASHLKSLSRAAKQSELFGRLILVEDCFIRTEAFTEK